MVVFLMNTLVTLNYYIFFNVLSLHQYATFYFVKLRHNFVNIYIYSLLVIPHFPRITCILCKLAFLMKSFGGAKESRTPDLLLARQAL